MQTRGRKDGCAAAEEARSIAWRRVEREDEILAMLSAPPGPGERIEVAYRRKEHELMVLFGSLSVLDSMELHRRLTLSLRDDPVATRFGRLVVDRRVRLIAFLAGARRREAIARAR